MGKYKNKIVYQGTEKFDSKRELTRWIELQAMERAGKIKHLKRQEPFVLIKKSKYGRAIKYVSDFCYEQDGAVIVEDVKSPYTAKNPVYRLKKRLMAEVYGIVIKEVY